MSFLPVSWLLIGPVGQPQHHGPATPLCTFLPDYTIFLDGTPRVFHLRYRLIVSMAVTEGDRTDSGQTHRSHETNRVLHAIK